MRTILVINSKGGCGKTTVATNLASYYASTGAKVAIMDYDPQGSSLQWVKERPAHLAKIHAANAVRQSSQAMISTQKWIPKDTEILFVDAPGGVSGLLLQDIVGRSEMVIVPVTPSAIDIHATAGFLKDLLITGKVRSRNIKVAVIANRVRNSMPTYQPLERFLGTLGLPLLTRIKDSDVYIEAVEQGMGVFELAPESSTPERQEFLPIIKWVDGNIAPSPNATDRSVARILTAPRLVAV